MAELKLTGIRVVQEGADQVKAELLSVGTVGDAAAAKVASAFQATAQAAQQAGQQMNVSQRAAMQMGVSLEQLAAAANGDAAALRALSAATQQFTAAATQNSVAVARMSAPAVAFRQEIEQITRMSAPAVSGFRQLAEVQERGIVAAGRFNQEISTHVGLSHSAVIGFGELARGVGKVAEAGHVGAFAMREFSGAAMRLGSELGPLGGLAGIFVLLGGVIVETFTKARREIEETQKKFQEEIAKMANAGRASEIEQRQRALLYGQPFDEKNQLRAVSRYAPGAFAGSLADLEAHFAALQQQIPRDATMAPAKIADEWNKVVKALDEARTQFAALRTAALNVANQPAEMSGLLPVITVEKITDAQKELEAQAKFTAASMDRITDSLKRADPEWTLNEQQYQTTIDLLKTLNAQEDTLTKIGERNARAGAAQVNAAAEQIKQADKYSDDLSKIWRDGIARITTDGFKSFLDFAEDLNQLFTRIMDRMAEQARKLGKEAGGAGYTALGIGVSAISGGVAGYQSGDPGIGAIAGGLAGSAFGPVGIAVGALAGLTGGLLGGAKAARERKEAEDQLRRSYDQSIAQIKNQLGDISDPDFAKLQAGVQFDALRKTAADMSNSIFAAFGITTSSLKDRLKVIDDLQQRRIKQIEDEAAATAAATKAAQEAAAAEAALAEARKNASAQGNFQLRFLNATGQGDAAFALQQQLELDQAIADGLDAISIRLLEQAQAAEKAQREQQKQTELLQDQLSTAQQQYDALKQVYDSLTAFKSSLAVGQYSPLSPRQQLDAARGQLNTLYQAALGGDQAAAGQFSGVASQFLEASRRYNASGAGYQIDFNSVNVMTDQLTRLFGQQMTDAQKQVSLLQQQLDVLKSIDASTITIAQRPLTPQIPTPIPVGGSGPRLDPNAVISADGFIAVVAAIEENTAAVNANTTLTKRSIDGLTAATANRRAAS